MSNSNTNAQSMKTEVVAEVAQSKSEAIKFKQAPKIKKTGSGESAEARLARYAKKVKEAKTEDDLIAYKEKWYAASEVGAAKHRARTLAEKTLADAEAMLKKAKADMREIEDDIARGCSPSAEEYKQVQAANVKALMESGDTEAMLALLAEQTAKAQKVVKSKGGRQSKASAVDKNWNPAAPSRVPTGLQINCTTSEGRGKKASEELWSMGGHYKCPYNCNADRTSLAGAKKHFDKCARRPNHDIGENRAKEKCAETNYEMSDAEIEAYWAMLKHTSGKCGAEADEYYKKTQKPLQTTISSHPSMYSVLFEDSVESESQIDTVCDSYCSACEELERGTGGENQMAHMEPGGCLYNCIMED